MMNPSKGISVAFRLLYMCSGFIEAPGLNRGGKNFGSYKYRKKNTQALRECEAATMDPGKPVRRGGKTERKERKMKKRERK
jgi:hypothetical protein